VTIEHCTLVHPQGEKLEPAPIWSDPGVQGLELAIDHSIVGPLCLPSGTAEVSIKKSIVDGGQSYAICGPGMPDDAPQQRGDLGPAVSLNQVTVFGRVHAKRVLATDCLFVDGVEVDELPDEAREPPDVRFSYLPPDREAGREVKRHPQAAPEGTPAPTFTSRRYGDPAYAQLGLDCPHNILGGSKMARSSGHFATCTASRPSATCRRFWRSTCPYGVHASIRYVT